LLFFAPLIILMRIAVLGSPRSWYLADLKRAAGDRHEIVSVPFRELSSTILGGQVRVFSAGTCLNKMDAVLVRTMAPGSLEQVVFRMDALAGLEAAGVLVVNPAKAIETAVNKHLATMRLQAAGLTVPRTAVCQSVDAATAAFETLERDIVLKPIFGSEGRGILRLTDADLAIRAFRMLCEMGAVLYIQEFVQHHGYDWRILKIGSRLLGMSRHSTDDWRTNVSRGAKASTLEISPQLAQIANRAAEAVGAPLAGIDLLPGVDGKIYAIEVNAVPGWRGLASAAAIDVANLVLQYLHDEFQQRCRTGVKH
jgi:RimK family alpha-L-glutamate ligase